jgi:hypothetical protein
MSNSLLFVDSNVTDYQSLLANLVTDVSVYIFKRYRR